MKCTLPKRHEAIADYLTNELSEEQTIDFEEHYLQCDVCFKELRVAEVRPVAPVTAFQDSRKVPVGSGRIELPGPGD